MMDTPEAHSDSSDCSVKQKHAGCRNASLKPLWRELSRVVQHNRETVLGYDSC
ncbi:hypothetical protein ACLK1S_27070 [Escherichia coli]